jgi:hypothetical protein
VPAGQSVVRSDTAELARDWVQGVQTIDTDRTQAAHGWLGGTRIELRHLSLDVVTPKAVVAVSSLDANPVPQSRKLLITAIARVVASPKGRMPLLSEPVTGRLTIRASEGLRLIPLDGDGSRLQPLPAPYAGGQYTITLPAARGTHWFLLTDER